MAWSRNVQASCATFLALVAVIRASSAAFDILNRVKMKILHAHDLHAVHSYLHVSLFEIEQKYSREMLDKHPIIGPGFSRAVGLLLSDARYRTIVLGVTGASLSCGNFSWPERLADRFSTTLKLSDIELRNAAMGGNSLRLHVSRHSSERASTCCSGNSA
jgi:hypothetical protein